MSLRPLTSGVRWGTEGRILAGGTDVMPQYLRGEQSPAAFIDISGIDGLGGISDVGGQTSIGALVTMRRLATASLISLRHPALCEAASAVGAWQTQYRRHAGRQHLLGSGDGRHAAGPADR